MVKPLLTTFKNVCFKCLISKVFKCYTCGNFVKNYTLNKNKVLKYLPLANMFWYLYFKVLQKSRKINSLKFVIVKVENVKWLQYTLTSYLWQKKVNKFCSKFC